LKHYERALNIELHAPHSDQLKIVMRHNNIGLVLKDQGEYDEALKSFERILENFLAHLPPRHPSLAITHNNIAIVLDDLNRTAEAIDIARRSLLPNHPHMKGCQQHLDKLRRKL
jgi:tetratricopeptide (TPR) repeat protein